MLGRTVQELKYLSTPVPLDALINTTGVFSCFASSFASTIEGRLREGMQRNGISGAVADSIVRSITLFALYGFPESHAASFALIAYASAYLKCHHAAAFFAAMLNCYPLGFYHPATREKDAAAIV